MSSTNPYRQFKKRHSLWLLGIITVVCFMSAGCYLLGDSENDGTSYEGSGGTSDAKSLASYQDVLEASYAVADILAKRLAARGLDGGAAMLYASFVNVDDLEESSTLGRIVSEQISSRIAQNGFRVLEMKLRQHSVYVKKEGGEFLLSREIQEIGENVNSDFVIVGTYAVAERSVYISVRVVNTADNAIVTGYDYQLQRNYQTDSLLFGVEG